MTDSPRDERDPLGLLPEFHRTTRMPLDAVVRLHFEGTVAYQNGFAANVSALGMFVKHPDPPAVGTRLVFEFVLGDERKPVQGGGFVAWARERYEGPGRPAGVGIQFTELDSLSRQHIAESLFEYLETQLGVEVADHPDVPNLLAAMPRTTSFDVAVDAAEAPGAPQGELSFAADAAAAGDELAPEPAEPAPPFRLFGDEAGRPGETDDGLLAEAGPDLFAPVVPPEQYAPLPEEPRFGAARRRESPRWLPIAIVVALVAGGLAVWWFLWGPGAEGAQAAPAAVETPAAPVERPRLDPQPGSAATLAEAVGVEAAPVAAPEAPVPAATPAETVESEPATESAPAPAPPPTSGERFTRVLDITWETFDGGTDVTLTGDGIFPSESFRWYEMRDERPRVLLRLTGVSAAFPRTAIPVGTGELAGVRAGFHEKPAGNELHIVLDLASPGVRVDWVDAVSNRLVARLRQP